MNESQKEVLAIHDISCVGRCSLTVALPILSAAGLSTGVLPTAILSTHTGGFQDFTYRDLSEDILPISRHWQSLGLQFDALYSGFLASPQQIDLVAEVFARHKKPGGLLMVDPVMGDQGALYSVFDQEMIGAMGRLCAQAELIVPNLTEAAFLLGRDYLGEGYDLEQIQEILVALGELGPGQVVLTGVSFQPGEIGAMCYRRESHSFHYASNQQVEGHFHGTGDIFSSGLLSGLMNGHSLAESCQIAVDYALASIQVSLPLGRERRYGVAFERALPQLLQDLGLGKG